MGWSINYHACLLVSQSSVRDVEDTDYWLSEVNLREIGPCRASWFE